MFNSELHLVFEFRCQMIARITMKIDGLQAAFVLYKYIILYRKIVVNIATYTNHYPILN